ncbi:MarR family winged helix-turn-helix transcriptional regulator [Nocardioides sp.]|uniref:MarR family winged helix-turn-helix transcriptional regulator n=1 Tax=Nocardioides sp. TaxID=35761 RepID=UPI002C265A4D|nr:MarR family transcriptional regulator [Nocardioides sp.]HSX68644.1 MarR family transcriptional regulator [Nocardioides sp.]
MSDQPHPGVLMFVSVRHVETRVMAALQEQGYADITLAQARVAARIADEGSRLTDLAAAAQVTKQTAGVMVDQLEQAGYVERVRDPRDARAKLVRFAPRGREVIAAARVVEEEVRQEWERHLGVARMEQLCAALAKLREITDPWV